MKLVIFFSLALAFSASGLRGDTADSAYANATISLTSSNSIETATANSSVNAGFAAGEAQPGLLDNSILADASAGGSATSYQNESLSGFSDILTINSPGLTGSGGTLAFQFLVTGTEDFAASAPAESSITTSATFTATGNAAEVLSFTDQDNSIINGSDFLGVPQTVDVDFTFGTPFTIGLDVDIQALISGLTAGSAMASGTFVTTGSTGTVTPAFTVSPLSTTSYTEHSASGADYAEPLTPVVPEPDTIGFAAGGIGALALWMRRRRH